MLFHVVCGDLNSILSIWPTFLSKHDTCTLTCAFEYKKNTFSDIILNKTFVNEMDALVTELTYITFVRAYKVHYDYS